MRLPRWGSFEAWGRIVRNALVWAGAADPGLTRTALAEIADTEIDALGDLIAGWEEVCQTIGDDLSRCTIAAALEALVDDDAGRGRATHLGGPARFSKLRSALAELISGVTPGKLPTVKLVGYVFRKHRQRVVGGKRLDWKKVGGEKRWFVVSGLRGEAGVHGVDGVDDSAYPKEQTEERKDEQAAFAWDAPPASSQSAPSTPREGTNVP